jgi:uncharacterized protein
MDVTSKRSNAAIHIEFGGETLSLLAQKAVVWAREKTLFVADVHLGKAASFRAAGIAVPSGHSKDDVARLSTLVDEYDIAHLVVLGDLVHNRASYTPWLDEAMRAFVATHPQLKRTLVVGNHDSAAGDCPNDWGFECIDDDFSINPFVAAHAPINGANDGGAGMESSFRLCGHLHPAAWLRTPREAVNLPCFWQSKTQLVLPSFGLLTGRYTVEPTAGDVTYVVTGQQIFRNPTSAV